LAASAVTAKSSDAKDINCFNMGNMFPEMGETANINPKMENLHSPMVYRPMVYTESKDISCIF
jgi:hypothetical protein